MSEVIYIQPHTDEWEAARCGRLTSSEWWKMTSKPQSKSEIFSSGAKTYIYTKIAEKLTHEVKSVPDTEALVRGLTEEHYARQRYIKETGNKVTESVFIAYNSIFGGTNDGMIETPDGKRGILEIKCPDSKKFCEIAACRSVDELKLVDKQYYNQCQANMFIAGVDFADFEGYDDRVKIYELQVKIFRMYPDLEWIKEFKYLLQEAAKMMLEKLKIIMANEENNKLFKSVKIDTTELDKLTDTLNKIQQSA